MPTMLAPGMSVELVDPGVLVLPEVVRKTSRNAAELLRDRFRIRGNPTVVRSRSRLMLARRHVPRASLLRKSALLGCHPQTVARH
jgi:hypothetical protein